MKENHEIHEKNMKNHEIHETNHENSWKIIKFM